MKVVYYFIFILLIPLSAANQERNQHTVENIEHYKKLVKKTRHEVDSLLNRLPELIASKKSGKQVSKKINKAVKIIKKVHKSLPPMETGIPDSVLVPDLEIMADTVNIVPDIKKDYKKPFLKRIFKQRKNKRNE